MNNSYVYVCIPRASMNTTTIQNRYKPCENNSVTEMIHNGNKPWGISQLKYLTRCLCCDGRYPWFQVINLSYGLNYFNHVDEFLWKNVSKKYWDNILLPIIFKFVVSVYLSWCSVWPAMPPI